MNARFLSFTRILIFISIAGVTLLSACSLTPLNTTIPSSVEPVTPSSPSSNDQEPDNPVTLNPADISGYVTITKIIQARIDEGDDPIEMEALPGKIYWIVDVDVSNKGYDQSIKAVFNDWVIVSNSEVYECMKPFMGVSSISNCGMDVSLGEHAETLIRYAVPDTLSVSDATLCYRGQEPFSYSSLDGGETVAAYDWDTGKSTKPKSLSTLDSYLVEYSMVTLEARYENLYTFKFQEGTGDSTIDIDVTHTPSVINYGHSPPTSKVGSDFLLEIQGGEYTQLGSGYWMSYPYQEVGNGGFYILGKIETYRVRIQSYGCDWWLKVGSEEQQ